MSSNSDESDYSSDEREECVDCKESFNIDELNKCNYCEEYFCESCDELQYISSTGNEEDYENDLDRMFCINCIKNNYSDIAPWDKK